ncbi:MAG TPA: SDR family NAD(P)-dependent oxidoreductase [Acidobacteriota bacterium]|nr:SDR family NAD(P)-dependent oxidoreductase [Acidobacteriota bacterium]
MMTKWLEGKCAVVTGGARGIGREICLGMARQGAKVVVNDIGGGADTITLDRGPADQVVEELRVLGGTAVASYDTVTDFNAAQRIIETCVGSFGKIDILVNCAGGAGVAGTGKPEKLVPFWESSEEAWDGSIALNLKGTFNTCRHALSYMVKQNWGRIINFTSPAWLGMMPDGYTAGKGGVVSLTLGMAQQMDFEGYHITCNAISPIAATRINPGRKVAEYWERLYEAGLITREICEDSSDPPHPEHIPPIILYLCTEHAANINGHVFGASGGRIALYSNPTEIKGLYKEGVWTVDELIKRVPSTLAQGLVKARG